MKPSPDIQPVRQGVLAIVGRPNVGKSALFNRLAGRRIAIVHEESGVTRDRLVVEATWGGKRFLLVDTGGITGETATATADQIQRGTHQQVDLALEEAATVIFVVDAAIGVVPLDEVVATYLRHKGVRVVLAANKCDTAAQDEQALAFARFGFPVFPVSAMHFRGLQEMMVTALSDLPEAPSDDSRPPLRVAIVGRPNVGKSSYLNRLLHSERVIVADLPGTTRDSIDIPFRIGTGPAARSYVLTDTAGIRPVHKIDAAVEKFSLIRAEESIARADVCVLLMDGAQGPTAQDRKIAAMILAQHKGFVLVVNKWDRFKGVSTETEYLPALRQAMPFLGFVPVIFASAQTGYNIRKTVDVIDHVAVELAREMPTGMLNRALQTAYDRVQPPIIANKRLKIFYAVQTGTRPMRLTLFVNDPHRLQGAYQQYLVNAVRETFGLEGVPVILHAQKRAGIPDHGGRGASQGRK